MKKFDLTDGMKLRDAGMLLASSKRAYILSYARVLAVTIAKNNPDRCVTADDVYRQLALLGHDGNLLGNAGSRGNTATRTLSRLTHGNRQQVNKGWRENGSCYRSGSTQFSPFPE
jgi:hypothetical protein